MLDEATVAEFKAGLRGDLIQPEDESYDEARKVYNGRRSWPSEVEGTTVGAWA